MSKLQQILAALVSAEEQVFPLFIHNPQSQKIAGVVLAAESAIPAIIAEIQALTGGKKNA